ncbi:MAG: serine/threonine protein phosphatase PrpC, partial [Myxococcota bacterium]
MLTASGHAASDKGKKAIRNDDAFAVADNLGLYMVADGMGGHAGADVAARLAVDTAMKRLYADEAKLTAIRKGLGPMSQLKALAVAAVQAANTAVHSAATSSAEHRGMGAALTVLLVADGRAVTAHVGHCRLYLCRDGLIHQLSTDHTIVSELLASGYLTPAEAEAHPFRNTLTRAIGSQASVKVDTLSFDVLPDDRLLLCTDGIWTTVPNARWLAAQISGQPDVAAAALVTHAGHVETDDDSTAVIVSVVQAEPDPGTDRRNLHVSLSLIALRSMFLFERLDHVSLTRVLNAARVRIHEAGSTVVHAGEDHEQLVIIVDGQFALTDGGQDHGDLGPGDYIGETTLLAPRAARATLTATTGGSTLNLSHDEFTALIRRHPQLGVSLLARLAAH